jgi:phenylalanine ammonia-lyase
MTPKLNTLNGQSLSLDQVQEYRLQQAEFALHSSVDSSQFFNQSVESLQKNLEGGAQIYGVNTLFGGLANEVATDTKLLQRELLLSHLAGTGEPLHDDDVRLAMVIRANSLCRGVSGIRHELVQRLIHLANKNITPLVHKNGSIGASGDLIPLSSIAGAIIGLSDQFKLKHKGEFKPAPGVLDTLGLAPISLREKEGLAMINGTACLSAIAANNCAMFVSLFNLYFRIQVAMCELLEADMRPFDNFVHQHRPHPGQIWVADQLRSLLADTSLTRQVKKVDEDFENDELIQDRYSIRCIPQFTGAIVEDVLSIFNTIEIEMNSATDNPLIDHQNQTYFHGGNFLGQHVSMAMDKMRVSIALLAKHNEAQLATLVEPAFNKGLPACLVDESSKGLSVGVKPIQILSNSLTPLLERNAAPLSVHFPIHAEQFNQNLNSQGFGSSNLTRESLQLFSQQLAAMWLSTSQAVMIRAKQHNDLNMKKFSSSTQLLVNECKRVINWDENGDTLLSVQSSGNTADWLQALSVESLTNSTFIDKGPIRLSTRLT